VLGFKAAGQVLLLWLFLVSSIRTGSPQIKSNRIEICRFLNLVRPFSLCLARLFSVFSRSSPHPTLPSHLTSASTALFVCAYDGGSAASWTGMEIHVLAMRMVLWFLSFAVAFHRFER
jgi:hypothetical protein